MSGSTRPEPGEPEPKRPQTLKELEEEHIRRVLALCEGRTSEAARTLGIGRATLYRRLSDLGIDKYGKTLPVTEMSERALRRLKPRSQEA